MKKNTKSKTTKATKAIKPAPSKDPAETAANEIMRCLDTLKNGEVDPAASMHPEWEVERDTIAKIIRTHFARLLPPDNDARLLPPDNDLIKACNGLLAAYAANADQTAIETGEDSLHSAVKDARKALRDAINAETKQNSPIKEPLAQLHEAVSELFLHMPTWMTATFPLPGGNIFNRKANRLHAAMLEKVLDYEVDANAKL